MKVEINIKNIDVFESQEGPDKLVIRTYNLAPSLYCDTVGTLFMNVSKGRGVQYVRDNFNVEPNLIKL